MFESDGWARGGHGDDLSSSVRSETWDESMGMLSNVGRWGELMDVLVGCSVCVLGVLGRGSHPALESTYKIRKKVISWDRNTNLTS